MHAKQQSGWTLLELLLVLVCVSALTAVLVYSLLGSIYRQQATLRVASSIEQLVDASHLWRQQVTSYAGIDLSALKSQGVLANDWGTADNRQAQKWQLQAYASGTTCQNNQCFQVQFDAENRDPCLYVSHLQATKPILTVPTVAQCQQEQQTPLTTGSTVQVVYA